MEGGEMERKVGGVVWKNISKERRQGWGTVRGRRSSMDVVM